MIEFRDHGEVRSIVKDGIVIAIEDKEEISRVAALALRIKHLPKGAMVAIIGLGTGILPRLLREFVLDIYEIEPKIVEEFKKRFPSVTSCFFIGDYKKTLPEFGHRYDAIVYDIFPNDPTYHDGLLTPYIEGDCLVR